MSQAIKILHLEDIQSDAELIKREMQKSGIAFLWKHVATKDEFIKALKEFSPDIILSDHTLPTISSLQALKLTRNMGIRVPFILITATVSEEFAVTVIKEGVSDYLLKDRLQRLPGAVLNAMEKRQAEVEKEEHLAELILSENRFRALIEQSHDMLALFDDLGVIDYLSPAVKRIFGFTAEKDHPKNVKNMVHPADAVLLQKKILEAIDHPSIPVFGIFRNTRKDGTILWIEGTLTNLIHISGVNSIVFNFRDITERKQAEDRIKKSEANLHAIIENSDVSILSLDTHFRYITFNSKFKNTLKTIYNLDAKVGDSVFDFLKKLHPDDAIEWEQAYAVTFSGKSLKFEKELYVNNTPTHISASLSPIWENERVIGLSCFVRDITDQKIAQEHLKESEERYRNIVETSQEGIWIIDEQYQTSFVNKKLCDILEYPADEMIGEPFSYFLNEESERTIRLAIDLGKEKMLEPAEFKFTNKSGKMGWANLSNAPLYDSKKKYRGSLAMVTDITNRKLYQESLIKSEANIRNIFDNTHIGYVLLDTQFHIISFNQIAASTYEYQLKQPLHAGKNLLDYFTGDSRTNLETSYNEVLKGERVSYEAEFAMDDQTTFWQSIDLSPVVDDKKILGVVTAVTNITERKESELQREKITTDLMQRNKDLEQFAYIVSHNLRAPVANILGICNLLTNENISVEERPEVHQHIFNSAQKLDEVILDLNHILQLKRELNEKKELVRFSELIHDIQISIGNLMAKENVSIHVNFDKVNEFMTLKSYMYSIFYNLITNSIKYRQPAINPKIEIRSDLFKNKLQLFFKDNGIGIDLDKYHDKVFGLYRRFHFNIAEGKGMGLFMVKTELEAIGGTIEIKSEVNKGTEFKIEITL